MKKKFTTTLEKETIKALKINAAQRETSVSNLLEQLINKYLTEEIRLELK